MKFNDLIYDYGYMECVEPLWIETKTYFSLGMADYYAIRIKFKNHVNDLQTVHYNKSGVWNVEYAKSVINAQDEVYNYIVCIIVDKLHVKIDDVKKIIINEYRT